MADDFSDPLGSPDPSQDGSPQPETPEAASAQQGDEGAEARPDGTAGQPQKPEPHQDVNELIKAREEAAYYRGLAAARSGGNGNGQPQAPPQLTEEQRAALEERFITDPYGVHEEMVGTELKSLFRRHVEESSVFRMSTEVPDYFQVYEKVKERANSDPQFSAQVNAQLANHPDPARVLYNIGKNLDKPTISDPETWRKQEAERIRKEIDAELRQKYAIQDAGATPPTPADATGTGGTAPANPKGNTLDPLGMNPFD